MARADSGSVWGTLRPPIVGRLTIAGTNHGHMLASDYSALLEHTRRVTFVEDRQAALLTAETCRVFDADTDREVAPGITEVQWEVAATELHSPDDSLFTLVFPEATDRRAVKDVDPVATAVST